MTVRRQGGKWLIYARAGAVFAFALGMIVMVSAFAQVSRAATTERIVTDPHTGLALYGVDPVAYFTDRKPVMGRAEFEYRFAGAIWRFGNEGNRAAFVADPKVYMPRFGGYDPIGIARGVSTPGYSELWTVINNQLYLFYSTQARATFISDPNAAIAAAEARWAQVSHELSE